MSDNRSRDILLDMKKNFLSERQEIMLRIQNIDNRIAHAKAKLVSLNNKEDSDFSIFSPRSSAKVFEDQIAEKEKEIEKLEEELRAEYKKLSNVTKQLDSLSLVKDSDISLVTATPGVSVMEEEGPESSGNDRSSFGIDEDDFREFVSCIKDEVYSKLVSLRSDLSLSEKLIDKDPYRVKQTLVSDSKRIDEALGKLDSLLEKMNSYIDG